jgi:hypothetical protein
MFARRADTHRAHRIARLQIGALLELVLSQVDPKTKSSRLSGPARGLKALIGSD